MFTPRRGLVYLCIGYDSTSLTVDIVPRFFRGVNSNNLKKYNASSFVVLNHHFCEKLKNKIVV